MQRRASPGRERLVEDLAEPLDACPAARTAWDRFPPSARKQMLWWVVSAGKPETRTSRIAKIVSEAEHGRRAAGRQRGGHRGAGRGHGAANR